MRRATWPRSDGVRVGPETPGPVRTPPAYGRPEGGSRAIVRIPRESGRVVGRSPAQRALHVNVAGYGGRVVAGRLAGRVRKPSGSRPACGPGMEGKRWPAGYASRAVAGDVADHPAPERSTIERPFCGQPAAGTWTSGAPTVDDPPGTVDESPRNVDRRPPVEDASANRLTTTCCDAIHHRTTTSCGFGLDHDPPKSYSLTVARLPDDARDAQRYGHQDRTPDPRAETAHERPDGRPAATSPHPRDAGQPPGRSS
jgi:hypothetical protein